MTAPAHPPAPKHRAGLRHVVVTGGAGFIGSHLVDALLATGARVTAVDNFISGQRENVAHLQSHSRFALVEADVIQEIPVEGTVHDVLHFASPASPPGYLEHPIETLRVGAEGTLKGLELAARHGARFMLASTSEVYGDPEETPQREAYWGHVNPIGPRSVYDEAKRYAEALTMAYGRKHGVTTRIVRIFNTYGPRMALSDGRALPNFICWALRGEPLQVYGDGTQTRSFCYVSDTVAGILAVLERGDEQPYNVGRPGEMSIVDFARRILALSGSKSSMVHMDAWPDDPRRRDPDITRIAGLGWRPEVSLDAGLARTLTWFQEQLKSGQPA